MKPSAPRPFGVPPEAEWRFEVDEWVACQRNPEGEYQGPLRTFRADGTPSVEYEFVDGRRHGVFRTYHPSGALAREGRYADDRLDGFLLIHTDGEDRLHALRECCVPEGARSLRQEYSSGVLEGEAFFDRDGRQLMPDGAICPERPRGVDDTATFDVVAREWIASARSGKMKEGVARRFDEGGVLLEEVTWREDRRHGVARSFAPTGELLEESEWAHGARDGAYFKRHTAGSALVERGAFERDHPVGCWRLEAASGEIIAERHAGDVRTEEQYRESPAFEDHARDAEHFRDLALKLRAEGRILEALCARTRVLAKDGEVQRFLEEVAATALPFDPSTLRAGRGVALPGEARTSSWLANWWLGAETKVVLEGLTRVLGATHRAALDFMSAGLLLEPGDLALRMRRAVARFELGDLPGMTSDLAHLGAKEREVQALRQRASISYGAFEFGEVDDRWLEAVPEDLPDRVEMDVGRIALTMRKCATRLELVRSALIEALERTGLASTTCLPPATGLLGGALEELERSTFELEEEGGRVTIAIDETLDLGGLSVPELFERARLDWVALCLLGWATGLDELGLPREILGRAEFKRALGTSIERCRIFEHCRKSSLARQDYPEEHFRGIPVPELTSAVVAFASAYYREVRAVLFYLTDPDCRSLWQDDLRPA